MDNGLALIVSGPSGSGQDTILRKLFESHPEIKFSISVVTRPRRGDPDEDSKYRFVSVDEFEKMIEHNEFLEHNLYVSNYYGTPRKPVEDAVANGDTIILEIDVNGAANVRKNMPGIKSVFIMPPSMEELERRLSKRGTESPEIVAERINKAKSEIERKDEYDYIVVNGVLETAVDDLYNIINNIKNI